MNRVLNAIAATEKTLREQLASGKLTQDKVTRLGDVSDMSHGEWSLFQDVKSQAHAAGVLTLDEAQTIYGYLGGTPATFNRQSVSVKIVLTKLFTELLAQRARWKIDASKPVQLTGKSNGECVITKLSDRHNGQPLPKAVSSARIDATLHVKQPQQPPVKKLPLKKAVACAGVVSVKRLPLKRKP